MTRAFAASWWANQWIAALEAFGWEGRLQRGRSYARSGRVQSIDIRPGRVTARVKGSRPTPYAVQIELPPLPDETWERIEDLLAAQARWAASLLAGEMPPAIEQAFAGADARLFPAPDEPLETDCSCPDWANPCKHVAAVHYVLGAEFDRDPFLLFRLRGRSKDELIAALRARRGDPARPEPPTEPAPLPAPDPLDPSPSLETQLEGFWSLGEDVADLRFSVEPPQVPAAVLKRLGDPTGVPGDEQLVRLYRVISERAIRTAYEEGGEA